MWHIYFFKVNYCRWESLPVSLLFKHPSYNCILLNSQNTGKLSKFKLISLITHIFYVQKAVLETIKWVKNDMSFNDARSYTGQT